MAQYKATAADASAQTGSPENIEEKKRKKIGEGASFAEYLAMLYGADTSIFSYPFWKDEGEAQSLNGDVETIIAGTPTTQNFLNWINKFEFAEGTTPPADATGTITATLPTHNVGSELQIEITSHTIRSDLDELDLGEALYNAFKMALLAKANPNFDQGIELEGTEKEMTVLYLAALKLGFADKIINKPASIDGILASQKEGIDSIWEQFVQDTQALNTQPGADLENDDAALDEEAAPAEEEQEEDITPELDANITEFLKLHVEANQGVAPSDEQIQTLWNGFNDDTKKHAAQNATDEAIEGLKETIAAAKDKQEPIETELTDALREHIQHGFSAQLGELSEEQIQAHWAHQKEHTRAQVKAFADPDPKFYDYIKKHAFTQTRISLTDEQAKQAWKALQPQERMVLQVQIDAMMEGLDEEFDLIEVAQDIPVSVNIGEGVKEHLSRYLSAVLRVSDITEEQIAEFYVNNGGVIPSEAELEQALEDEAAPAGQIESDSAENNTAEQDTAPEDISEALANANASNDPAGEVAKVLASGATEDADALENTDGEFVDEADILKAEDTAVKTATSQAMIDAASSNDPSGEIAKLTADAAAQDYEDLEAGRRIAPPKSGDDDEAGTTASQTIIDAANAENPSEVLAQATADAAAEDAKAFGLIDDDEDIQTTPHTSPIDEIAASDNASEDLAKLMAGGAAADHEAFAGDIDEQTIAPIPAVSKAKQQRLRGFLKSTFGNAASSNLEDFRQTWNAMEAGQQQDLLAHVGVESEDELSYVATAAYEDGILSILNRHINDAAFEILKAAGIDEDTYRDVSANIINAADARNKAVQETTGMSVTKVTAILKAMDAEGLTSYKKGTTRSLNVNNEGVLKLTKKEFAAASADSAEDQQEISNTQNSDIAADTATASISITESAITEGDNFPDELLANLNDAYSASEARAIVENWHNTDDKERIDIAYKIGADLTSPDNKTGAAPSNKAQPK